MTDLDTMPLADSKLNHSHNWKILQKDTLPTVSGTTIRVVFYCKSCLETQVHSIGLSDA